MKEKYNMNIDGWNLLGVSKHIRELRVKIAEEAKKPLTVLVQGPTGTGKELIAKDIHNHSSRKNSPFEIVNCAAIPENLFESELFGHEKGAFTGALNKKRGQVDLANGGTLFLDEVGDLSADHQVKLLRFLQNKTYRPVGAERERSADVRVIAASNKDLSVEVKSKTFREDLYYRLSQSIVKTVPLKDRPEDIIFLVNHFASIYFPNNNKRKNITIQEYNKKILLYSYHYPGNVRQLQNYMYKNIDQIIEEWKEELLVHGFDYDEITEFKSYEDFYYLEKYAKNNYFYSRPWIRDGESFKRKPSEAWAKKLLNDPEVYVPLKAIAFVGERNIDVRKIIEAYEIITLLHSGMPKSRITEFLEIRKEKVSGEVFKEHYGLPLPENDEPRMQSTSLKMEDFHLFQAELTKLEERSVREYIKRVESFGSSLIFPKRFS